MLRGLCADGIALAFCLSNRPRSSSYALDSLSGHFMVINLVTYGLEARNLFGGLECAGLKVPREEIIGDNSCSWVMLLSAYAMCRRPAAFAGRLQLRELCLKTSCSMKKCNDDSVAIRNADSFECGFAESLDREIERHNPYTEPLAYNSHTVFDRPNVVLH